MRKNIPFNLFLIFIIAILFRLWFIDKPEGLWNDEYVSWYIATRNNFGEFISDMLKNCHTPLYYIYIKFWLLFFPDNDYSLRISSVIPSLLTILVMFFVGKEIKNSKTGLLCSFLTAISSFCIYFAQEVRLYSLLMFFSALALFSFIKICKNYSKIDFICFFIFNALICAIHTLGIVYAVFNILFLFIYLYKYSEEYKNKLNNIIFLLKYLSPFIIIAIFLTPFWYSIVFSKSLSQFWSEFSISKILFTFIDYFSPIQSNLVNSPDTFLTYALSCTFLVFAIIPSSIAIYAIYKTIKDKNKLLNYILYVCIAFFTAIILISLTGKMILLTKYTCEIYPALILLVSYGLIISDKKHILTVIFIGLNLSYLYFAKDSAPKRGRSEGNYAAVSLIKTSRLKAGDIVILTYYDVDKFERYLKKTDEYKFYSINKFNFNNIMFDNPNYTETIKQGKIIYKDYFTQFPNLKLISKIWRNYFLKIKKGDRVGILFLNTVSFLSNENIQDIVDEETDYNKTPFIFLAFSNLKNNLLYAMKDDFKIDTITQSGDWTLFVFEKI